MTEKILSAGDYISAKCTKCKATTNHTIVAMVGKKVVKVECNTCGGTHNYRSEAAGKKPTKRKATTTKPATESKAQRAWEEIMAQSRSEDAVPYSMATSVTMGMLIQHPSFGLGLVINCIRPNKMEVRFQSGVKLLRCKLD